MSLIVSVLGFASSTGATKKRHRFPCPNHLWSSGLLFFGSSQFCGSFLLCGGPKQLKHIQAGNLGLVCHFSDLRGLCLYISSNESEWPICIGCYPVYMCVSAKITGEWRYSPHVPGTADHIQDLHAVCTVCQEGSWL